MLPKTREQKSLGASSRIRLYSQKMILSIAEANQSHSNTAMFPRFFGDSDNRSPRTNIKSKISIKKKTR